MFLSSVSFCTDPGMHLMLCLNFWKKKKKQIYTTISVESLLKIEKVFYLLVFDSDKFFSLPIVSRERQDGNGTLRVVILSQFTEKNEESGKVKQVKPWKKQTSSLFSGTWSSPVCTALCSSHNGCHRSRL